jgi:hypothetical protein
MFCFEYISFIGKIFKKGGINVKKILLMITMLFILTGCSFSDNLKDFQSDIVGLDRTCTLYYPDGTTEQFVGNIRLSGTTDGVTTPIATILVDGERVSSYGVPFVCKEN